MNTTEFGKQFEEGFSKTVRVLMSHGIDREAAEETAQGRGRGAGAGGGNCVTQAV
jgi:hypothetical protein